MSRTRPSAAVWLPLVALAVVVVVHRFRSSTFERLVLGLGSWVMLQAAAVAYPRGASGAVPASRYLDSLSFGLVVNTMALLFLLDEGRRRFRVARGCPLERDGALGLRSAQSAWRGSAQRRLRRAEPNAATGWAPTSATSGSWS